MSPDIIGYILAAVATLTGAFFTSRAANKANKITADIKKVQVDGAAYDRAQKINEQIVEGLTRELQRVVVELTLVRDQLDSEKSVSSQLRARVATLERTVARMTLLLTQHSIDIPATG